jgi:hypothetical protein
VLVIAVCIVRPGVWDTLRNTYFDTLDPDSARGSSYEYRYTLMRVGREALAQDLGRAAWGFGPESYYYLGLEGEDPETGHTVTYDSCDSAIVEIMVETGYVGLFLVVLLLLRAALFSLRGFARVSKPANLLCLIFLINIVAYAFMMLSVENFGWGQQTYMLWIILATSMAYPRLAGMETAPHRVTVFSSTEALPQFAEVRPS